MWAGYAEFLDCPVLDRSGYMVVVMMVPLENWLLIWGLSHNSERTMKHHHGNRQQ